MPSKSEKDLVLINGGVNGAAPEGEEFLPTVDLGPCHLCRRGHRPECVRLLGQTRWLLEGPLRQCVLANKNSGRI